jgi:YVTN family beta-propeller protein
MHRIPHGFSTPLFAASRRNKRRTFLTLLSLSLLCGVAFTQSVTTTVVVGRNPSSVGVNPVTNKIYVTNANSNDVTVVDGRTNTTATINVGSVPMAVALNTVTDKIYVANYGSNSVTVIDGRTNTTSTVDAGSGPRAVAVNSVTNKVYVANLNSNNVTIIDGANDSTSTIEVGMGPRAIAVNLVTDKIYVANARSNALTVIDGATNSAVKVEVESGPQAVALDPVTNKIYVTSQNSNSLTVIDGATNEVLRSVRVGSAPVAVAVNPTTHDVYVVNSRSNNVTVVGQAGTTTTVAAGAVPLAIVINPARNRIYVTNGNSNVTIIDGETNRAVAGSVVVGTTPLAVTVNTTTHRAYVANYGSNSVTVIDETSQQSHAVAFGAMAQRSPEFIGASGTAFDAFRNYKTGVEGYTEYNPTTCAYIDHGAYTATVKPKYGKLTFGIIKGMLGNGQCPGHEFLFAVTYYTWTADSTEKATSDPFSLHWQSKDFIHDSSWVANLAPRISVSKNNPADPKYTVWWFGGEKPSETDYPTKITLTAAPSGYAPYTWKVTAGNSNVTLSNSSSETVEVTSAQMSAFEGGPLNVHIEVFANRGGPSNPEKFTVRAPYEAVLDEKNVKDTPNPDPKGHGDCIDYAPFYWYKSALPYDVKDQFGMKLDRDLPVREHFTSGVKEQCSTCNWVRSEERGSISKLAKITDTVSGQQNVESRYCFLKATPEPMCPNNNCKSVQLGTSTKEVHCFGGEVWVGSTDVKGVKIMTLTWERYQDHARHCNVTSPVDGTGTLKHACDDPVCPRIMP